MIRVACNNPVLVLQCAQDMEYEKTFGKNQYVMKDCTTTALVDNSP